MAGWLPMEWQSRVAKSGECDMEISGIFYRFSHACIVLFTYLGLRSVNDDDDPETQQQKMSEMLMEWIEIQIYSGKEGEVMSAQAVRYSSRCADLSEVKLFCGSVLV